MLLALLAGREIEITVCVCRFSVNIHMNLDVYRIQVDCMNSCGCLQKTDKNPTPLPLSPPTRAHTDRYLDFSSWPQKIRGQRFAEKSKSMNTNVLTSHMKDRGQFSLSDEII